MAYEAEISRRNPTLFVFLIDQSSSMNDPVSDSDTPTRKKADALAVAINRLLENLVIRCSVGEGIRDFFFVSLLGYGKRVEPALSGPLAGHELVSISQIAQSPAGIEEKVKKVDDGVGGIIERGIVMRIWIKPHAEGGTPMCEAISRAHRVVEQWLETHPNCFPPVVVNITDGESTDGVPTDVMRKLTSLSSTDGKVLLFNIHISSQGSAKTVAFPADDTGLPAEAIALFEGSSILPPAMRHFANSQHGMSLSENSRGYVFNGDMVLVIQALDIGSRPSNLR